MKTIFILIALVFSFSSIAQEQDEANKNPNYDAELAKKLSADDYGMKNYYFVLLKSGTNKSTEGRSESFKGHMENMGRLVEEEKLVIAGPFGNNELDYRGIFILGNIASEAEAKEILDTDPAIKNNYLTYDLVPWYGSAALPEYLPYSDKIWKLKP